METRVSFFKRVHRKLTKLRLRPVRVFCLHHVCEQENPLVFCPGDWISLDCFKESVQNLKNQGYHFISLELAQKKIAKDLFRFHKYAVLTFDDGYRSSLPAFFWLEEQGIPYTLFLNAKYLDGVSASQHIIDYAHSIRPDIGLSEIVKSLYLTKKELNKLSPTLSSFGSHGYEHIDATTLSDELFISQLEENFNTLRAFFPKQIIPFHAYTWGRHNIQTDFDLFSLKVLPVLIDGTKNYHDSKVIHRELLSV